MLKTKIITFIIVSIFTALSVSAADQKAVSLAVKGLSQKLQTDLAMTKVNLELKKVENQSVSTEKVIVSGFGTVKNAEDISLTFDVAINPVKNNIIEISYDIVSPIAVVSASDTQNFLTKEVLGKIKNDYQTNEIVVAIDEFETVKSIDGKTNYIGVAEIKIGAEWNRIEFDVQGNAKIGAATEVKYKLVE